MWYRLESTEEWPSCKKLLHHKPMPIFFEKLKTVKLSSKERSLARQKLYSFIKSTPVRVAALARLQYQESNLLTKIFIWRNNPMTTKLVSLILLATIGGSGVSYAAEGALPGDTLYPIKIHVNEEVRTTLSLSARSKAEWSAKRAERRLEEAEKLALQGKLDVETRTNIETNFKIHAKEANKYASQSDEKDRANTKTDINSTLEVSLQTHGSILGKIGRENIEMKSVIAPLLLKIESENNAATKARIEAETEISKRDEPEIKAAAEEKLKASENKIAETQKYIENEKNRVVTSFIVEAKAKLDLAIKTIADGKLKLQANLYSEAFNLFQQASRIAQEAKIILDSGKNLNTHIKIDTLEKTNAQKDNNLEAENETELETETEDLNDKIKVDGSVKLKIGL